MSETQSTSPVREDRDENLTLTLPDGRIIGFARYGAAQSPHPTTIYLHGYPSTRLEPAICSRQLLAANLQLISVDRPGLGLSTPSSIPFSDRTILHHAEDVRAVADHLNLQNFIILGYSGGAPSAFACTYLMPERLSGAAIVAGFGPYAFATDKTSWRKLWWLNKLGLTLPIKHPKLYTSLYGTLVPFAVSRLSKSSYEKETTSWSFRHFTANTEEGKMLLSGGQEFWDDGVRNVREAVRQEGYVQTHVEEARLLAKDWPFELKDVRVENVRLFYGEKDVNVPVEIGQMIADAMHGRAVLRVVEGGTHAGLALRLVEWIREVLGLEGEEEQKKEDK